MEETFYDKLYDKDLNYGTGKYDFKNFLNLSIKNQKKSKKIKILDIGCGKGELLEYVKKYLNYKGYKNLEIFGLDIDSSCIKSINQKQFKGIKKNFNDGIMPFEDNSFDIIFCFHLIEHIFYTDKLLREIKRISKINGKILLETPNIACIQNRLLLLFGIQPLSVECSSEKIIYGSRFKFIKNKLSNFDVAGHIRGFTYYSLIDMCKENFSILNEKIIKNLLLPYKRNVRLVLINKKK